MVNRRKNKRQRPKPSKNKVQTKPKFIPSESDEEEPKQQTPVVVKKKQKQPKPKEAVFDYSDEEPFYKIPKKKRRKKNRDDIEVQVDDFNTVRKNAKLKSMRMFEEEVPEIEEKNVISKLDSLLTNFNAKPQSRYISIDNK